MKPITLGSIGHFEVAVRAEHTAHAIGNVGMHVLSSPFVLAYAEMASLIAIRPFLEEGEGPAGVEFHFNHRAPAAAGAQVVVTAVVEETKSRRVTCRFRVETADGRLLADGTVGSVVVNLSGMTQR